MRSFPSSPPTIQFYTSINILFFMIGLITPDEQKRIFEKLVSYYENIHSGLTLSMEEATLSLEEIGNVHYTYQGEAIEATQDVKVQLVASAVKRDYRTPVVILRKEKDHKDILLDGHRRLIYAWSFGESWPALIMKTAQDVEFGVEKTVRGKIKDLFQHKPSATDEV